MILILILKGLIIGIFTAIPVGPASVLCISRTLNYSRKSGYVSGLGAATADGIFSGIAGFGISVIMQIIIEYQIIFKIIAVIVLCGLAGKLLFYNPYTNIKKKHEDGTKGLISDYVSTLGLTLSNPMGILGFAAVFTGFNVVENASMISIPFLILGVISGAAIGWFFLISFINMFKKKIKIRRLTIINRVAGIIILLFVAGIILSIF